MRIEKTKIIAGATCLMFSILGFSSSMAFAKNLAMMAKERGAIASATCKPCGEIDISAHASQNAEDAFPSAQDNTVPNNASQREEFKIYLENTYVRWQTGCSYGSVNGTNHGEAVFQLQQDAATYATKSSDISSAKNQKELMGECSGGADLSSQLSQYTSDAQTSPMMSNYKIMTDRLADPSKNFPPARPSWKQAYDLPERKNCQQTMLNFVIVLESVNVQSAQTASMLNQFNKLCQARLHQLEEDAKNGSSIDKALKLGQLGQMGLGALKAIHDMKPPDSSGVDPNGFGPDPFDFDPTGSGSRFESQVPSAAFGTEGSITNGAQSAFVPDTNLNGVQTASLSPGIGDGVSPRSESASGGFGLASSHSARRGGNVGTSVGGSGASLGDSDSSGASRAPGSEEEGETVAADNNVSSGFSSSSGGGGIGSMLGLSTDPDGVDSLMAGFKNPFEEKKAEEPIDGPLAFSDLDPDKLPRLASASKSKAKLPKDSLFFRVHHRIGMRRERGDVR